MQIFLHFSLAMWHTSCYLDPSMSTTKSPSAQQADGYREAESFDTRVNDLLAQHPIATEPFYWLALARTVKSSFEIVLEDARTQAILVATQRND